jgi:hypothetical protein
MRIRIYLLLLLALVIGAVGLQGQISKRLVLKDGSYQMASKWEVKGDRVRYYSTERADWEEMPESLVDWKATEQWEKDHAVSNNEELEKVLNENKADEEADTAANPLIAPGVRLPDGGGVFLLDTFKNQPQLVEIVQNSGEINKQTGRNILRATINPIASSKQSIERKGAHARVQAHTTTPEIYIDIDMDTQSQPLDLANHFRIVKLQEKKDMRVLGNLKISMIGKVSRQQSFISAGAEKFSGDWVKVIPQEALEPGEYAVVEMLTPKEMNLYVWDFGVNPAAPENPTAWKPDPAKPNPAGTDGSPVLVPHKP